MNKILATTDFSSNSKRALRFAIQLASQMDCKVTFFHSYHVMRPTQWNEKVFVSYENSESTKINAKLQQFVASVYKDLGINATNLDCVAKSGASADRNIMDFAEQNNYTYICLSRKGDGKSNMLFGTNTSTLINKSKVPVIAVPQSYKSAKITKISYASDLSDIDNELKKVTSFTKNLDVKVELLHFKSPADELTDADQVERINKKLSAHHIDTHFENLDYEKTLIKNIDSVIKQTKPSMMIMFTQQKRTFFEKIFLSSISAEYSSVSKIPLLVFRKSSE
ncbi:nucleotide-binding universal stress UspA family protein [Pedobacter sp. CG_S7]|uniref:universal stress protein n=1 Tax=Pedobacter sp. CG_S7 TaxID=3143930 RepID=UPI003390837C